MFLYLVFRVVFLYTIFKKQRYMHFFGVFHKHAEQFVLDRGESGVPVKRDDAVLNRIRCRYKAAHKIERLFHGRISVLNIILELLIQKRNIAKLPRKHAPARFCGILRHLGRLLGRYPVLHELGYDRLDPVDIAGLVKITPEYGKLLFVFVCYHTDEKALSDVIKHRDIGRICADLVADTVGKPRKRQDVDIEYPMIFRSKNKLALRLQPELLGYDHKVLPVGMLLRVL